MTIRIGIRPTNDFAFKKTFGSPGNTLALIRLLNAILNLPVPIVEVTIQNPFNPQDFQDDKLSVLDIRAVDQRGAIYDIELQLLVSPGLTKRIVFYGCEVYAGQMRAGDQYHELKPVYSNCLLHAHEYDEETLKRLFAEPAFWRATDIIARIARITQDKTMYDTREKAIRDQQWLLNSARAQGFAEGLAEAREETRRKGEINAEIYVIQNLPEMFGFSVSDETSWRSQSLEQLRLIRAELSDRIKNSLPSPASETELGGEE